MRTPTLLLGIALGACATAAGQSVAAPASPSSSSSSSDAPASSPAPTSTVIGPGQAARRRSPPGTATVELLARGSEAFVGRLTMDPGAKVPTHRDPTEEYIVVLAGGGTIHIDGTPHRLEAGSTVYMAPNAEVRFENGTEPLVAIQVFAGPQPADKYDAWTAIDSGLTAQ